MGRYAGWKGQKTWLFVRRTQSKDLITLVVDPVFILSEEFLPRHASYSG